MAHNSIINLAEFDSAILGPAVKRMTQSRSHEKQSRRLSAYSFASVVSAYFWIVLGVEAEYFSAPHAQSLFGQRFTNSFNQFDNSINTWGYIFDPEMIPLLQTAISHRTLSNRESSRRIVPGPIAFAALRTAIQAEGILVSSREANAFISLLNFEPEVLRQIIHKNHALERIDELILDRDAVARGFERVWAYAQGLIELSRRLQEEDASPGKRCDLRIRQLTRWRVNRHSGVDEVFLETAQFVNAQYCGGIISAAEISARVERLLDDWGFTHMRAGSAGN